MEVCWCKANSKRRRQVDDYVSKELARKVNESDHARCGGVCCWMTMGWTVCGGWKQ